MEKRRQYEIDGLILDLPLRWDEATQQIIQDYSPVIDHPLCTPEGRPILLTLEDACPEGEWREGAAVENPAGMDCGACRHFRPVPGTLLGVCQNEKRKKKRRGRRSGPSTKTKEEMK